MILTKYYLRPRILLKNNENLAQQGTALDEYQRTLFAVQ